MSRDELPEIGVNRIGYQQILEADHSVFSIQWMVMPGITTDQFTSAGFLRHYLAYVERFTFGIVTVTESVDGIEFRLAGSSIAIIKFLPPEEEKCGCWRTTLRISGGLLVQPKAPASGELEFIVEPVQAGLRVIILLSGYYPLLLGKSDPSAWRRMLYRMTQAQIHRKLTVSCLEVIFREVVGWKITNGGVMVDIRRGEAI